jgi:hypothetical protein
LAARSEHLAREHILKSAIRQVRGQDDARVTPDLGTDWGPLALIDKLRHESGNDGNDRGIIQAARERADMIAFRSGGIER